MVSPNARAPRRANREDDADRSYRARARRGPPPIPKQAPRHARPQTTIPIEQFGPYLVYEMMGEGGMACVHRAERVGADGFRKQVALKRMWAHLSDDQDFVESFVQEARLASSLRHDHIAQVYECGKIDDTYYMAMELVPGPTLNDLMIQSRTAAGPIPLPIVVEMLTQLCDALAHAHAHDIIHRDVSPANVIVSSSGSIKLIDFGIAKAAHSRVTTQAGFIKGKLSYVAPEYTLGKLDHRADLFAIGVIAHELLTGRRLFLADTDIAIVHNVREKAIVPPSRSNPTIPHDLDDIVMTALQRDPDQRWQNTAAMRVALANAAHQIGPASGRQIHDWIEWAFMREPWRDSMVDSIVRKLETPREPTPTYREPAPILLLDRFTPPPPSPSQELETVRHVRQARDSSPTIVEVASGRLAPWLVLLVLATMLAAAAAVGWLAPALSAI